MAIRTDKAAKPVGAYVHAKEAGNLVFLSGEGPRHPETDEIPDGWTKEQWEYYGKNDVNQISNQNIPQLGDELDI